MKNVILVTGGAGFIGSHVCKSLAQAGYLPVVYDNLSNGHEENVKWGPFEKGDILNLDRLNTVIKKHQPSAVMHFAAFIEAGESVVNPLNFYHNNVVGSISLLNAMRNAGLDKIVFSSTAAVYGEPQKVPIKEDHPLIPVNPYGQSKMMIEMILEDISLASNLRYCALRYFNASGADPDGELYENHDPETHLIPLALRSCYGLRDSLSIFGTDYDTPDGTCIRDYVHVADLAKAHILALEHLLDGGNNLRANLGIGQGFSVKEVVETVMRVTGRDFKVNMADRRAGDPAVLIADGTLARKTLGWEPEFNNLSDHISHAASFYIK